MEVTLFGIKNDYHRDGFKVSVPPSMNPSLCPVKALQCYIERTSYIRPLNGTEFLSLNKPYRPLSATGVATVLNTAINLAGLDGKGYTARSFRPTGATTGVIKGQDPNIVSTMGPWKSTSVFEEHYVHTIPPNFTDVILDNIK